GRPWLLVVGPADEAPGAALGSLPDVVVARSLPPRVLGSVLRQAGCFVGNDSGVSHLAAAFGAPVLALFGPTDPTGRAPLRSPPAAAVGAPAGCCAQVLRSPAHALDRLSLDEVVARARAIR